MARTPIDELARLSKLRTMKILDTPAEVAFDAAVSFAATLCNTPMSLVSLVDESRQWFKAKFGVDLCETAVEHSFCARAIDGDGLFEIPDASRDPRFADNPLVVGPPRIRFYAGMPLALSCGTKVGTLCVIDTVPRRLTETQAEALGYMATQLATILDQRYALQLQLELSHREAALGEQLLNDSLEARDYRNAALHEGIAQDLAGAKLLLGNLPELDLRSDAGRGKLAVLNELIGNAISECRNLASEDGGVVLSEGGLAKALQHLAMRMHATGPASVRANTARAEGRMLSPAIEHHLYRIAAAGLQYVREPARTSDIMVLLESDDWTLDLAIVLRGSISFGDNPAFMEMIRFRATKIGGTVAISNDGDRQTLLVRVPCPAPEPVLAAPLQATSATVG